jgi:hypothetical protein
VKDVEQLPVRLPFLTVTETFTLKPGVASLIWYAIDTFPLRPAVPWWVVFVVR